MSPSFEPLPSAPLLGPLKINRCTGCLLRHLWCSFTCVFLFLYVLSLLSHRDEVVHVPASAKIVNKISLVTWHVLEAMLEANWLKFEQVSLILLFHKIMRYISSEFPKKQHPITQPKTGLGMCRCPFEIS